MWTQTSLCLRSFAFVPMEDEPEEEETRRVIRERKDKFYVIQIEEGSPCENPSDSQS